MQNNTSNSCFSHLPIPPQGRNLLLGPCLWQQDFFLELQPFAVSYPWSPFSRLPKRMPGLHNYQPKLYQGLLCIILLNNSLMIYMMLIILILEMTTLSSIRLNNKSHQVILPKWSYNTHTISTNSFL